MKQVMARREDDFNDSTSRLIRVKEAAAVAFQKKQVCVWRRMVVWYQAHHVCVTVQRPTTRLPTPPTSTLMRRPNKRHR